MLALLAALVPDEPGAFYFPDDLSRNSLLTLRSPVQVYPSFWYVLACETPQNGPDLNLSQHCALLEPTSRPRDHYINTPKKPLLVLTTIIYFRITLRGPLPHPVHS